MPLKPRIPTPNPPPSAPPTAERPYPASLHRQLLTYINLLSLPLFSSSSFWLLLLRLLPQKTPPLSLSVRVALSAIVDQLGEHGIWGKVTNFEDATHTALIMAWPGSDSGPRRSTAFVEFVDIFPTLADLAGIAIPPLCPLNSSGIELCTEGTSLRPIFQGPGGTEVKRAAFSQYPHGPHGNLAADTPPAPVASVPCPPSAAGRWFARDKLHPTADDLFVLDVDGSGAVTMDIRGCPDCGFAAATGRLTPGGVELTLTFAASPRIDRQTGTLVDGGCGLDWVSNSSDGSGHWSPFSRAAPPVPPAPSGVYMGYTMVTRIAQGEGVGAGVAPCEVRYTEWPRWIGDPGAKGTPDWSDVGGRELYNHTADPQETVNVVDSVPASIVAALSGQLRAGWRYAIGPGAL